MMNPWTLSALWVGLALIATSLAIRLSSFRAHVPADTVAQLVRPIVLSTQIRHFNTRRTTFLSEWGGALPVVLAGILGPFADFLLESLSHYPTAIIPCRRRGCQWRAIAAPAFVIFRSEHKCLHNDRPWGPGKRNHYV